MTTAKKPTVHYRHATIVGNFAFLLPVDHPNHKPGHDVSNCYYARTSKILAVDAHTGVIETMNTIYAPFDASVQLNGRDIPALVMSVDPDELQAAP